MTPREALDRIADLCDESAKSAADMEAAKFQMTGYRDSYRPLLNVEDVRAVLAEVTAEPGGVLDRDQAREEIDSALRHNGVDTDDPLWEVQVEALVDRLAGCVRPAAIDRDALLRLLMRTPVEHSGADYERTADAILALVRPVAGVTLTPEEAALVVDVLREIPDMDLRMAQIRPSRQREIDDRRALAARLEAAT